MTVLVGDIVLCPWARHYTLKVLLSTGEMNVGGNPRMDKGPIQWGVEILSTQ